jgi:hypothetical protein
VLLVRTLDRVTFQQVHRAAALNQTMAEAHMVLLVLMQEAAISAVVDQPVDLTDRKAAHISSNNLAQLMDNRHIQVMVISNNKHRPRLIGIAAVHRYPVNPVVD